ncbi:MAG TPA: pirin family protein [Elusimicrobiota bacterium]|nr:pirin family protein [Elusimicrobiota bacterium]
MINASKGPMPRTKTAAKSARTIRKIWKSQPTVEGAGVRLRRGFGFDEVPQFDPFLLFDDFRSNKPADYLAGFPWHPHRGIETITYVLSGDVEHGDSMGNRGIIGAGDVQWMTAGSGVIHQEMPKGDAEGRMLGFQLWANLPKTRKMMPPRYREVKSSDVPVVRTKEGATIRVICGRVHGAQGPVREIVTDPEYLDVEVPPGSFFAHAIKRGYTAFAYVFEGEGYFDRERDAFKHDAVGANYFDMGRSSACGDGTVVLYDEDGEEVVITADQKAVRFLLVSGKPLREPVAWYGPIVMNTQEELRTAFEEFEAGTFVKNRP